MIKNSFKYILILMSIIITFCSCSSVDSSNIEINKNAKNIPQESQPQKHAPPTNPPINIVTTKYSRPNVLKIAETLNSLSNMISVVEGQEQALEYSLEFLRLYTQTLAMRDIIIARYISDNKNNSYNIELNFWLNYQKELDLSIYRFAKAINNSKHNKYIADVLGADIISALNIEINTSEKTLPAIEDYELMWETCLSLNSKDILALSYNTFITGTTQEKPPIVNYEKLISAATNLSKKRNISAVSSGYKDYFEYILSHRNYTKSELWTMAKNIRENFSPITEKAVNNFYENIVPLYSNPTSIYKSFSDCTKSVSNIYKDMLTQLENNSFIDISAYNGKTFITDTQYINGTNLPFISVGVSANSNKISLLSEQIGQGYYLYNTDSMPKQTNGWLISACGKGNIFILNKFYDVFYPKDTIQAKNNDVYAQLRLTSLNTLIYELEEYIYQTNNITENSITTKYNQLYKLYFPNCKSEQVKNSGFNIALHQIILQPLYSCDKAIGGVIALNMADISYKDNNAATKRLNSLLVADTNISIKYALEKLSIPSPFSGLTTSTIAYFADNLTNKETITNDAIDISSKTPIDSSEKNQTSNTPAITSQP